MLAVEVGLSGDLVAVEAGVSQGFDHVVHQADLGAGDVGFVDADFGLEGLVMLLQRGLFREDEAFGVGKGLDGIGVDELGMHLGGMEGVALAEVDLGDAAGIDDGLKGADGDVLAAEEADGVADGDVDGGGVLKGGKLEGLEDLSVEFFLGAVALALWIDVVLDLASLDQVAGALAVARVVDAERQALLGGTLAQPAGGHDVLAGGVLAEIVDAGMHRLGC